MSTPALPRIRQVVLAARELGPVAERLQAALSLRAPFSDPGVGYFGLRNAVFALGDTFIEIVSPVQDGTAAGRLLERRGGDSGYMVMVQVEDLPAARERARGAGLQEVFEVELDDITEVHLHPGQMRGAIVSMSAPRPPGAWRWGGPDWEERSASGHVAAIRIGVADPDAVEERWRGVLGAITQVEFVADGAERGLIDVTVGGRAEFEPFTLCGVRFAALR
jgi:Glyoxalase-like domain